MGHSPSSPGARALNGAYIGSIAVAATGVMVVAGWLLEVPRLTQPLSSYGPNVKTNAGLALACGGLSNLLLIAAGERRIVRWSGWLLAFVCLCIGALTLSEHVVGWDVGIDRLFATEPAGAAATASPNRTGPPASIAFVLLGAALLLVDARSQRARAYGQAAALTVCTLAMLPLVGYAFGLTGLFANSTSTGISITTATALLVLSLSTLAGRPAFGLAGLLCREDETGAMARQLFAAAVLLPFGLGWLLARAYQANIIDGAFAISLMTVVLMIGLTALIWRAGAEVGRALDQRVAVERALTESARSLREVDRQKNAFLATLSHELRNPLAPIRFALEMLAGPAAMAERAKKTIARQVDHLVHLVDDLLDLTRIAHNKLQLHPKEVDAAQLLGDAVDAVAPETSKAGHDVVVTAPSAPVWMTADPNRVIQILSNLLTNAARYTPPGGRITAGLQVEDGAVVFFVRDNGMGLSEADVRRVFDMFVQVGEERQGGLGIGLALVRGLVQLHGGSVEARSDGLGRGSEFRVRLPRAHLPLAPARAAARSMEVEPPRTILIVDDNADAADTLRDVLDARGHRVAVAYNAADALAKAVELRPDVGLLDLGLPDTDGLSLAGQLRSDPLTERMLLIAITGWGQEEDRRRALAAGFDAHVTKPADPAALAELIASKPPPPEPGPT
jgi:signal transduction histidine kinase/ActR/RegA family two-component response regulator